MNRLLPPLPVPVRAASDAASALAPSLQSRSILIVEDEGLLALDMEFALIDAGADVLGPVVDVKGGLDLLSDPDLAIDAAILDLDLRGVPVYPIADLLKSRNVPFVFHTGHGRAEELQQRYGEDLAVFTKPSRIESILAKLAGMIGGPG